MWPCSGDSARPKEGSRRHLSSGCSSVSRRLVGRTGGHGARTPRLSGQHPALEAIHAQMPNEKMFAFMDDVEAGGVGVGHTTLGVELFNKIHIHESKTEISNSGDIRPGVQSARTVWPMRPMQEPLWRSPLPPNKASKC